MKKKFINIMIVLITVLFGLTGCGSDKETMGYNETVEHEETVEHKETEEYVETEEQKETEELSETVEPSEPVEYKDIVEYGDTIKVFCRTKCESVDAPTDWTDKGELEFTVETSTWEFQMADYELPEDIVQRNVDEAIGKGVGDTFTLRFEGGDGSYGYEYTILEIRNY